MGPAESCLPEYAILLVKRPSVAHFSSARGWPPPALHPEPPRGSVEPPRSRGHRSRPPTTTHGGHRVRYRLSPSRSNGSAQGRASARWLVRISVAADRLLTSSLWSGPASRGPAAGMWAQAAAPSVCMALRLWPLGGTAAMMPELVASPRLVPFPATGAPCPICPLSPLNQQTESRLLGSGGGVQKRERALSRLAR